MSVPETSDELLGELAHELSLLVRRDVELAAAQHGTQLRHVGAELAAALAAGAAFVLALAAASLAAIQALTLTMPSWTASLIVAAVWAATAGLLLRLDHPRRLLRRLAPEARGQAVEAARERRDEAEQAVKATAERLSRAIARETTERELRAGVSAAEHLAGTVEHDAEDLVKELIAALLAPGKAGMSLLERIVGRQEQP